MLQCYMLERLVERVSRSRWRDQIIVKGGVLIGFERRTTKDLDTTIRGLRSRTRKRRPSSARSAPSTRTMA